MKYCPDKWLVIKITERATSKVHYRVFATWHGGYMGSDSWKLNSGIVTVTEETNSFNFNGDSGSVYNCAKHSYSTTAYGSSILKNLIDTAELIDIEIMPEDTDWANFKYE